MLTFPSRFRFHIVVMAFVLATFLIASFFNEELRQLQMLRIFCNFVQTQQSKLDFRMTRVSRKLALLVSKSGCEEVDIFENRREKLIILIVEMM